MLSQTEGHRSQTLQDSPVPGFQSILLYPTAHGCPRHTQPQCGLTAHHDCAHTPLSYLHSGGRYFLHISHNSADGQSLQIIFAFRAEITRDNCAAEE